MSASTITRRRRDSRRRAARNRELYGTVDERKERVLEAIDPLGITPLAVVAERARLPENVTGATLGLLVGDRKVVRHGRRGWERR
ncbi:MAG TPA: hypothetical protein VF517_09540 [Thermoleophilaceae bacterium]